MIYVTLRGRKTENRPYRTLSTSEREQILRDYLDIGSLATREKWNISNQTINHVKYHQKWLLEIIEEENMKARGL